MKHPTRSTKVRGTRIAAAAAASLGVALLSACSTTAAPGDAAQPDGHAGHAHGTQLAVSTPGGITVLASDPEHGELEVTGSLPTEEFARLNAFGDGTHLLVTTSKGFEVLDSTTAEFTGLIFPATAAGHVVRHDGATVLFDDGTGLTTIMGSDALLTDGATAPETRGYEAAAPHHGVSILLADGTLLTTVGTADARTGAAALAPHDDHWHEHAVSAECPGIHGEGTAQAEVAVFGCEDGALLYKDGAFTKLASPDAFGRIGNAFATADSPIVVGDYRSDPDAEGYLLDAVSLIDTAAETLTVAQLPEHVRYTYRDVVRGPGGNAYILSTDGAIHVLDAQTGTITESFPVVAPWAGPENWQDAHPTIVADGDSAYVTEPATSSVHTVNLQTGKIVATAKLDAVPNEIAVAIG